MSDYTLPPRSTLIVGMTGSGKTTFAQNYLQKVSGIACRFIFDDTGQMSHRLKISHAATALELENALATKWVVFNPHRMFPGNVNGAFDFFCDFVFKASQRGRGRKIFFVDEAWRFQNREKIPQSFAVISQMGRAENLELVIASQVPSRINASITGSATELVCFRLQESVELRKVQQLGADAAAVGALPPGQFISFSKIKSSSLRGRVF